MAHWDDREKKYGKPKFVNHSKHGGFPKAVWLARKRAEQQEKKAK